MNKIGTILSILFFLNVAHIQCIDPSSFLHALGYPHKIIERRMRAYASRAPFSIESQLLVDMIVENDVFTEASKKGLIPCEAFLFKEAAKAISSYNSENFHAQRAPFFEGSHDFFSQPLAVEAYLFWVGKDPGTEMKRRAAASMVLHMAIHEDAPAKTIELILARGADINTVDAQGNSALILATGKGRLDIVELLLVSGADFNSANEQGQTAFTIALTNAYSDIVEALLDRGAYIGRFEKVEDAALNLIVKKSLINAQKYEGVAVFLINRGANVNNTKESMTPLMIAARDNNPYMAQLLINHGAEINTLVEGTSPLRLAFQQNDQGVFDLLCSNGADINAGDMNGETILHAAIKNNDLEAVQKLFKAGATPNTVNHSGWTPIADAVVRGHEGMMHLILKNGGWKSAYQAVNGKLPQELAIEKGHTNIFGMLGGYY
jgi:ankyrin repeat protein